mmetsp:Transcript_20919/g.35980  ORF Transcript_20919/g.35980 Transcript_20919/m.35980 type:complete len:105 (+) Transcript_20919:2526-2840(+)
MARNKRTKKADNTTVAVESRAKKARGGKKAAAGKSGRKEPVSTEKGTSPVQPTALVLDLVKMWLNLGWGDWAAAWHQRAAQQLRLAFACRGMAMSCRGCRGIMR